MRKFISTSALTVSSLLLPVVANAQTIQAGVGTVQRIVNDLLVLVIGIAILVFFFGLIRYLTGGPEMKAKGLTTMIYGIVAIFIMVSLWGLVGLLQSTFLNGTGLGAPTQLRNLIPQ